MKEGLKDDPRSGHLISSGRSFQMLRALTATAQCPLVFNLAWPAARGSQVTLGYVCAHISPSFLPLFVPHVWSSSHSLPVPLPSSDLQQ